MHVLYRLFITAQALAVIDRFLTPRKLPKMLRVGVRQCGSRLRHYVECADIPVDTDIRFVFGDISFFVDLKSIAHINGSVLHWVDGTHESGLKFRHFNNKSF